MRSILYLLSALFILIPAVMLSQVGLRPGLNIAFSQVDGLTPSDAVDARAFPDLSLLSQTQVTEQSLFQAELAYRGKGYSLDDSFDEEGLSLHYVEATFLGVYEVSGEAAKPLLMLGPHIGYAVDGELDGDELDFDQDDFQRLDFGLSAGLGLLFLGQQSDFFIDVRFNWGFINIADSADFEIRNRAISLGLGFIFQSKQNTVDTSG